MAGRPDSCPGIPEEERGGGGRDGPGMRPGTKADTEGFPAKAVAKTTEYFPCDAFTQRG